MGKRALLLLGSLWALGCHQPVSIQVVPSAATLIAGDSFTFAATVSGATNSSVVWSVREGAAAGTVTSTGSYTAPASLGVYHVVATSVDDPTTSAAAEVTVIARPNSSGVSISVTPVSLTMPPSASTTLVARVTGASNTAVSWQVDEGTAGGSIVQASLTSARYTANGTGVFHVTATALADTSKSAKITVTVQAGVVFVSVSPANVTLARNGTVDLSASVFGAAYTAVSWSVDEGTAGGSVVALATDAARYTAPAALGTFHVTATSAADPLKSGSATVTVTDAVIDPPFVLFPNSISMTALAKQTFTAFVSGVTATALAGISFQVSEGAAGGSISADGTYSAPATPGIFHVTAQKGVQSALAEVRVGSWGTSLAVNPGAAAISPGATVQITSQFFGTTLPATVTWRVLGGGTVSPTGLYSAPTTPGVYAVEATAYLYTSWPAAAAYTTVEVK